VLSLFVLLWFFIVPVPGLIVFTADDYRLSVGLGRILFTLGMVLGIVVLGAWLGRFIQWLDRGAWREGGLRSRLRKAFGQLQALTLSPGLLSRADIASAYALLTDAQTFVDQRSYEYARAALGSIETILRAAGGRPAP
jgi:hypothetical protein